MPGARITGYPMSQTPTAALCRRQIHPPERTARAAASALAGERAEINNNPSERLQGTIRDKDKTLKGSKQRETGQAYVDGLVLHYNYFRPHESPVGRRPAEAEVAELPFNVPARQTTPTVATGKTVNGTGEWADERYPAQEYGRLIRQRRRRPSSRASYLRRSNKRRRRKERNKPLMTH